MAENNELKEQINAVVDARANLKEAATKKTEAYNAWMEDNSWFFQKENEAKQFLAEAEEKLRESAIVIYKETGDKAVAPGIGIRVMTRLGYDTQEAFLWGLEHKLALKLDSSAFEKIAKTSNLSFVTISEEPQATIATELQKVE